MRDEADYMLLGREFQTFRAHDEKRRVPIKVCDSYSVNRLNGDHRLECFNVGLICCSYYQHRVPLHKPSLEEQENQARK